MHLRALVTVAGMLVGSVSARADTFIDYTLSGILDNTAVVSGTFHYDVTNLYGSTLTHTELLNGVANVYNAKLAAYYGIAAGSSSTVTDRLYAFDVGNFAPGSIWLAFQGSSGFDQFCLKTACIYSSKESYYGYRFVSGSVTPLATLTPEPSSLVLLGTGLLGLTGAIRRRFI